MLKAYVVRACDPVDDYCAEACIVFAPSANKARSLGWRHIDAQRYLNTKATRMPSIDKFCKSTAPYVENQPEVYREANFQYQDEECRCDHCGKVPFGIVKYAVCDECYTCLECGNGRHADEECDGSFHTIEGAISGGSS